MRELHKLRLSVERVIKAFKGTYNLKDLSDEVDGIKDTFDKIIHGKLASINPKDLVELITNKAKVIQLVLNDLPKTFNEEQARGNKATTWADLTKLKKDIAELKQLSLQFPPDILKKVLPTLNAMRTRLDEAARMVDLYLTKVKKW